MKTIKKITLTAVSLFAVVGGVTAYINLGVDKVEANPDYICTRSISGGTCSVNHNNCTDWNNKQRTCRGTRITGVRYINRRSDCAPGYSQRYSGHDSDGASGRKSGNYYTTSSCSVVEYDNQVPDPAEG